MEHLADGKNQARRSGGRWKRVTERKLDEVMHLSVGVRRESGKADVVTESVGPGSRDCLHASGAAGRSACGSPLCTGSDYRRIVGDVRLDLTRAEGTFAHPITALQSQ